MEQGDGKGDEQQAPPNSAGLRFTGLQAPQAGPGTSSSAGQRMGTTVRFHSDLTPMKDEHRQRASVPMGLFSPGALEGVWARPNSRVAISSISVLCCCFSERVDDRLGLIRGAALVLGNVRRSASVQHKAHSLLARRVDNPCPGLARAVPRKRVNERTALFRPRLSDFGRPPRTVKGSYPFRWWIGVIAPAVGAR
jgi:hypothetical protein